MRALARGWQRRRSPWRDRHWPPLRATTIRSSGWRTCRARRPWPGPSSTTRRRRRSWRRGRSTSRSTRGRSRSWTRRRRSRRPSSSARRSTTSGRTTRTSGASGGARRSPPTARPPRSGRRCSTWTRSRRRRARPWVFHGANCLPPANVRCMVSLSPGGSDASVQREFDTGTKQFVSGGFSLPEAKSSVAWRDEDTLWVGTDFGPGSLTTSGYPRIVKLWKRGTPLSAARTVFEGKAEDVASSGSSEILSDGRYDIVTRTPAFFRQESFLLLGDRLVKLDLPEDSRLRAFFRDRLLFSLRSDWTVGGRTYRAGSLLAGPVDDILRGDRRFDVLFEPSERVSLAARGPHAGPRAAPDARQRPQPHHGALPRRRRVEAVRGADARARHRDVRRPRATRRKRSSSRTRTSRPPGRCGSPRTAAEPAKVKTMPAFFDATGIKTEQFEATSKDGTKIPYFVVTPKGLKTDGTAPTLLYGYGGFEVSEVPRYSGTIGSAWLARGGVFVLANIRGGGEFGPAWHKAAVKEQHIHNFEDFSAVARDLIARKITSAAPPRDHGRLPGRPPRRRDLHALPGPLPRRGRAGAARRHAPVQPPPGRGELDGGVRRPGQARGLGVHPDLVAVPPAPGGREVPDAVLLDEHARRPRSPRATRARWWRSWRPRAIRSTTSRTPREATGAAR